MLRRCVVGSLGGWVTGRIVSLTKGLMLQLSFFHNFLQNSLWKSFQLFWFFYNFTKIKSFECPKSKPSTHYFLFYFQSIKIILGPSDAWLRRWLNQRPSVLYWRFLIFWMKGGLQKVTLTNPHDFNGPLLSWGSWKFIPISCLLYIVT